MRIVTKGKEIEKWSSVEGTMTFEYLEKRIQIKCNSKDFHNQFVVIFEKHEVNKFRDLFEEIRIGGGV